MLTTTPAPPTFHGVLIINSNNILRRAWVHNGVSLIMFAPWEQISAHACTMRITDEMRICWPRIIDEWLISATKVVRLEDNICTPLDYHPGVQVLWGSLCKKASNHHANHTPGNVQFYIVTTWETPGNHWCWWPNTLIITLASARAIIKVSGHQHQWFPGVSQVVTM